MTALVVLLGALVVVAVIVAGGGSTTPRSAALPQGAVTAALAGSPIVLAALHAQANELLAGGTKAFQARLRQLRGYPVVINKWASWCGPCQTEFPAYQRVSVALGKQVAFVGIDGKDTDPSAAAFLRRFPVSYPSYVDPHEDIARSVKAATYYPQTVYIDRGGAEVYDHAGPYETVAALESDIRRYVLR
ncbi:MAG TPA: TlpA disulfide reductase family protein [Solirubrobacteraceae bacterium]|nr:TlpA disulfide reductase family protein [Solirubrobacteraceae bacterium]